MYIRTARDAADRLAPFVGCGKIEKIAVAVTDANRRLLSVGEVAIGDESEAVLPIREIIAEALRLDGRGMVIAHNHPSSDPRPSHADIDATRRLARAARGLEIALHDHLIYARGEWRSLRGLGLL